MAARHGRNGRVFVAAVAGAQASPLVRSAKWSLNSTVDFDETTSFSDTVKQYVAGLPDASGSIEGFWDDSAPQLFQASQDGVGRKIYLYPDFVNDPGTYIFGTAFFDNSIDVDVKASSKFTSNWRAASAIIPVGSW